jgi:hypothetical protein
LRTTKASVFAAGKSRRGSGEADLLWKRLSAVPSVWPNDLLGSWEYSSVNAPPVKPKAGPLGGSGRRRSGCREQGGRRPSRDSDRTSRGSATPLPETPTRPLLLIRSWNLSGDCHPVDGKTPAAGSLEEARRRDRPPGRVRLTTFARAATLTAAPGSPGWDIGADPGCYSISYLNSDVGGSDPETHVPAGDTWRADSAASLSATGEVRANQSTHSTTRQPK